LIAGAWVDGSRPTLEKWFGRFIEVTGAPASRLDGQHYSLGSWSSPTSGSLDEATRTVWVGNRRAHFEDASRTSTALRPRGDYAAITVRPDGLLLARGRYTGRSLYYAFSPGLVLACTRLETLAAVLDDDSVLEEATMAAMIVADTSDDRAATVYHRIRRVVCAEAVLVSTRGVAERATAEVSAAPRYGSAEDLVEDLRTVIRAAVARSLEGKKRVAVMVSGGLDSSCILGNAVANARGASQVEVDAVTLSFASTGDDRPHLDKLCDELGIVPLRMCPEEARPRLISALTSDGAPQTWPTSAWEIELMKRARERGAESVLTGVCGDQLFSGDPRVLARSALHGHWIDSVRQAIRFRTHWPSSSVERVGRYVVAPFFLSVAPGFRALRRRRRAAQRWPWAGPRLRSFLTERYQRSAMVSSWREATCASRINSYLHGDFLEVADARSQAEVAAGIARWDPFLDDELFDRLGGFPLDCLVHGGGTRGLFRLALRGLVPESLRLRTDKSGFDEALTAMIGPAERSKLFELADMRELESLGFVDAQGFRSYFERILAEGATTHRHWLTVWPALAVESFIRDRLSPIATDCRRWRASA
jgi:asparagine synthase (glutamine-hydrolysing)